jgi:hypothetical protein
MPRGYEKHFMRFELWIPVAVSAGFFAWLQKFGGAATIDLWMQNNRAELYGTVAGILGTLLGFVITVVSIILALWSDAALQLLRESGHGKQLWAVMKSCMRWLAFATVMALILMIFDRDGAMKPKLLSIGVATLLVSSLRVARTVWILERIIGAISSAPGQPPPTAPA